MSYHHTAKPEWQDGDHYDAPHSSPGSTVPPSQATYNSYPNTSATSQASPFVDNNDAHFHQQQASSSPNPSQQYQSYHHDDDEQYPVGRPLSYFQTHHQPLSQQEYDEEQRRTSQYHQMEPLEHAHSTLDGRQWSSGGYSGYQPHQQPSTDIPLVGIDIISSNLDAAQHSNYSDTRTPENMMHSPGAGVGVGVGVGHDNQFNQYQQQQQYDNKQGYSDNQHGYPSGQPPPPLDGAVGIDGEPIPKALLDPKVQKQLNKRKVWRPWFVWVVSAVQIAVLIFEIVKGYQRTGQVIETHPFNPMIGPGTGTIISVGARFVPCMRSTYLDTLSIECPDNTTQVCTISDICGFTPIASTGKPPNQWFRFITPIFLHGGIVHLLFNLMFQLRTGADLERDMGFLRFGIIYMISGIVGFILGGNFAPLLS
ncbi:hypothetical protein BGZ99_001305, partial [Dissophora globulifera]